LITLVYWRPITDCVRWDPRTVPLPVAVATASVVAFATVLVVALLWSLPNHVFGTEHYTYQKGAFPKHGELIRRFPYGLVRHPAAAGFLWMYWAFPNYSPSHILLASMWSIFIIIGTLVFEEGGLRGEDEFGKKYSVYSSEVAAFYPTITSLRALLSHSPTKTE